MEIPIFYRLLHLINLLIVSAISIDSNSQMKARNHEENRYEQNIDIFFKHKGKKIDKSQPLIQLIHSDGMILYESIAVIAKKL